MLSHFMEKMVLILCKRDNSNLQLNILETCKIKNSQFFVPLVPIVAKENVIIFNLSSVSISNEDSWLLLVSQH